MINEVIEYIADLQLLSNILGKRSGDATPDEDEEDMQELKVKDPITYKNKELQTSLSNNPFVHFYKE